MDYRRYNKITLIVFLSTLISVVLLAVSFWNVFSNAGISGGAFPVVFFILSLCGFGATYYFFLKATNRSAIEEEITARVSESKAKIFEDLKNETEEEKEETVAEVDIEEKINAILPKGSFKSEENYAKKVLENLASEFQVVQGIFYMADRTGKNYTYLTGYALTSEKKPEDFKLGDNLNGQVAKSQEIMTLAEIPEEYFEAESGLGKSKPKYLTIFPIVDEKSTRAVVEIATFIEIGEQDKNIIQKAASQIADKLKQLQKS